MGHNRIISKSCNIYISKSAIKLTFQIDKLFHTASIIALY